MEWENGLSLIAMLLAYICIFTCRCYRKAKRREVVALLLLIASAAPFLLKGRSVLTIFYAVFALSLMVYFELLYERRLRALGEGVNGLGEYQPQSKLLLLVANKISEVVQKSHFSFYSPRVGKLALQALATRSDSPLVEEHINNAFVQALRFVYDDVSEKWGEPSRGQSISLVVEQLNKNAAIYIKTATVGNMADINEAAKHNLKNLFSLYYQDFYLKAPGRVELESPEAFATLRQKFERSLTKFPLRFELAYPMDIA